MEPTVSNFAAVVVKRDCVLREMAEVGCTQVGSHGRTGATRIDVLRAATLLDVVVVHGADVNAVARALGGGGHCRAQLVAVRDNDASVRVEIPSAASLVPM